MAVLSKNKGGKPLPENRDEVEWIAACFDYYAEIGRDAVGRVISPVARNQFNFVIKEPYGVCGLIVPWNYPLLLLAWKLAPALAAGNTVVAKPSEHTPLSTLRLAQALEELPEGVVNFITGYGPEAGVPLVAHRDVELVAFTGSQATGRQVAVTCAEQLKKCHLELGGNDPLIVDEGVDLDVAAQGAAWACYLNMGPVAPIVRCRDIDEAIALADRSEYGLGASIYTNSLEHAMKAMEQVHAGTFWINDPLTDNDAGPFGGMRRSGIGRELGSEGIDDFRDSKHVHLDYVIGAKPYWYPYRYERPRG